MVMLLAMALLTVAALWLRRRDRCAYERRLAREAAARAVVEDRLVIARELHDAVSGNLGAITVRCAVAQRLETSPDGLRHALRDVESASREATDGLRRMLAVLRDEGAAAHGIPDPTGASGMAGPVRAGSESPVVPATAAGMAGPVRAAGSASPAGLAAAGPAGPARAAGAPGGFGDRMIRPARGAPAGAGAPHGAGTAGAAVAASWRESGIGAGDPDSALAGAVTRARRAGVEVEIDADRGAGPSPMGEAVARVVGEALVNTARHAGPSRRRRSGSRLDASPRHRPGTSGTARAGRGHGRDAERGTPPRCRRCWSWWRRRCWRPGRRRCGWDGRGRRGREGGLRRRGGPAAARDADRRSRRGDRFESRPARVRGGIP